MGRKMNKRFLVVSRAAAEAIAADRLLQSCEFEQGLELAAFLKDQAQDALPDLARLITLPDSDGFCFLCRGTDHSDAVIFDLDKCPIFADKTEEKALLVFQKILRFALRYWSKQKFTAAEHMVRGTTKGVLFPFPISTQSSYRVLIECAPDAARLSRRPQVGTVLLIYWAGKGDHQAASDVPSLTVFRKALEALSSARSEAVARSNSPTGDDTTSLIALTRLDPLAAGIDGHLGFDTWEPLLTSAQRSFVRASIDRPHRIEGPAGSGKTICLVLRAIRSLRDAAAAGTEHRSLFLAHSAATKNAIRALFAANDPDGFASRDPYRSGCGSFSSAAQRGPWGSESSMA